MHHHNSDVVMTTMASQITNLTIVCSTVYSGALLALCAGNSPVTGEFPAQRASIGENVSIWWRHHDTNLIRLIIQDPLTYIVLFKIVITTNITPQTFTMHAFRRVPSYRFWYRTVVMIALLFLHVLTRRGIHQWPTVPFTTDQKCVKVSPWHGVTMLAFLDSTEKNKHPCTYLILIRIPVGCHIL